MTSKFAVRAFSTCLREELADTPEIAVVTVLPQAVDTPIWEHAANRSGRAVRPVPPVADPEKVARAVLACAQRPRREVTVGTTGRLLEVVNTLAPGIYARMIPSVFQRLVLASRPVAGGPGNLHDPASSQTRVSGDRLPSRRGGWSAAIRRWRAGAG